MAIKAYSGITSEWYTPDSEEGFDDAAQFELKGLTGAQLLEVQQHFDIENQRVLGPGLVMACRLGLTDWKNIVDEEGKERVFTRQAILLLPAEVLAELGGKVISLSVMDDDETKN